MFANFVDVWQLCLTLFCCVGVLSALPAALVVSASMIASRRSAEQAENYRYA